VLLDYDQELLDLGCWGIDDDAAENGDWYVGPTPFPDPIQVSTKQIATLVSGYQSCLVRYAKAPELLQN